MSPGPALRRFACMALVGGIATLLYAGITWAAVAVFGCPIVLASPLAYGLSALWSYQGHRRLTFADRRPGEGAVLRFSALTLLGYGASAAIPAITGGWLGAPPELSILVTCLAIPALNYVVLNRHVFAVRPAAFPPAPSAASLRGAGPHPG